MTFRVFLCTSDKPCGKMDVNTFSRRIFPCLGVISLERYICDIEKTALELSLVLRIRKITTYKDQYLVYWTHVGGMIFGQLGRLHFSKSLYHCIGSIL